MRIVVAGGAGFIGSHLCDALLAAGHEVWAADNFATGRRANVAHLAAEPRFHLVETDITAPLPADIPPVERIYHLASPASPNVHSPRSYMQLPLETAMANTLGTKQLLDRARQDGARLLFASTSEIYGDPLVHPQTETYRGNVSTTGPRAVYDEAKRFGETLVIAYWRAYGVAGRLVRIFNTYGERMDPEDGRVLVNFVMQALRGEPLTIYGDGSQTRAFCHVSDLVRGLQAVMEREGLDGEVFNLGNAQERTISDLARLVQQACDVDLPIVYEPLPTDDPTRRCPDITKARTRLGWKPDVSMEDGLRRTLAYFREEFARMTAPASTQ
ncbi:MAG TPA: UDP-glucuronic acid decarboxylase family protein [Thermomicrobiales bacterium]|nr:UDP-glucuronic acid decarboxylase family protein [Thermomicrobiales bacterium]